MKTVTINEIADQSGVSIGTVSRVLTGNSDVNANTRKRIIRIIKETGFIPKVSKGKRNVIGLLINPEGVKMNDAYINQHLNGMYDASFSLGYDIVMIPLPWNTKEDIHEGILLEAILRGVKGVMIHQAMARAGALEIFRGSKIKTAVYQDQVEDSDISWIDHDNYHIMHRALQTLNEYGYHRIIFAANTPQYNHSGQERLRAFKDFSQTANVELKKLPIKGMNEEMLTNYFVRLLGQPDIFPFGITGINSYFVGPLYRALAITGTDPSGKIGIIGIDNADYYRYLNPPLSTIVHPFYEMGRKTVEILVRMINGEPAQGIMLDSDLVVRKSLVPAVASGKTTKQEMLVMA